jgi:hypothetical protein
MRYRRIFANRDYHKGTERPKKSAASNRVAVNLRLRSYRSQNVDTGQAAGTFHIATAQGAADIVELVSIFQRQTGGPTFLGLDQFDVDFGNVTAFMNQFTLSLLHHFRLVIKSLLHLSGSGRYAVTSTAGAVFPFGIPHIT